MLPAPVRGQHTCVWPWGSPRPPVPCGPPCLGAGGWVGVYPRRPECEDAVSLRPCGEPSRLRPPGQLGHLYNGSEPLVSACLVRGDLGRDDKAQGAGLWVPDSR